MDLGWTEEQMAIRDAIDRKCRKYGDSYWLDRDRDGRFPEEFVKDIAEDGWLGIAMPEEFGGAGLGLTEACIMMQTIFSVPARSLPMEQRSKSNACYRPLFVGKTDAALG